MEGYIRFSEHADIQNIEKQLPGFIEKLNTDAQVETRIMPITHIRHELNSDVPFTLNFIGLFVISGALLLFAALFNFMNFHIDMFSQRHRELHLRMVNGASGGELVRQMLVEQGCAVLASVLLGAWLIWLVRPAFSGLLEIPMEVVPLTILFAGCTFAILVVMLLLGGIAFSRLSKFAMRPASIRENAGRSWLRHGAITLQLAVSILFIVASLVVMQQMRFVNHKELGLDKNGVLQLTGFTDYGGKVQAALMQELAKIPQITSISDAYFQPQHTLGAMEQEANVQWEGKASNNQTVFHRIFTDEQFAETFRLKFTAGTYWQKGQRNKVVLNETAVRTMELKEPIGSIIRIPSIDDVSKMIEYEVVGVVKDFHALSMRNSIKPMVLLPSDYPNNMIYMRVVPGEEAEAVRRIMDTLRQVDPIVSEAKLTAVGDLYEDLNRTEEVGLDMFSILATISLLLSLCGIYAIATASTRRRRKEIAIRKVMGANLSDIIRIFFREYIAQVVLSSIIAIPLAWWIMQHWLEGYAYRISISGWILLAIVAGTIAMVLLTVFGQIYKAANGNPARVISSDN